MTDVTTVGTKSDTKGASSASGASRVTEASIDVVKVVGNRKQTAVSRSKGLDETAKDLQKFINVVVDDKKSKNGNSTISKTIEQTLASASEDVMKLDEHLTKIYDLCQQCEYTAEVDAAADEPVYKIETLINDIRDLFTHFSRRILFRAHEESLATLKKHQPRAMALLERLKEASMKWRKAFAAHVSSQHFADRLVALDSGIDFFESEVIGTKRQKELFFQQRVPDSYAALAADKRALVETVIDESKFDNLGIRLPGVPESDSGERSNDSIHSSDLDDDNLDLASDEIDPDADVTSEDDEDSEGDEDDSAVVSDATGLFEHKIAEVNKEELEYTERKSIERNGKQLRSGGFRKIINRIVPVLEASKVGEQELYRKRERCDGTARRKKKRSDSESETLSSTDSETDGDD